MKKYIFILYTQSVAGLVSANGYQSGDGLYGGYKSGDGFIMEIREDGDIVPSPPPVSFAQDGFFFREKFLRRKSEITETECPEQVLLGPFRQRVQDLLFPLVDSLQAELEHFQTFFYAEERRFGNLRDVRQLSEDMRVELGVDKEHCNVGGEILNEYTMSLDGLVADIAILRGELRAAFDSVRDREWVQYALGF